MVAAPGSAVDRCTGLAEITGFAEFVLKRRTG